MRKKEIVKRYILFIIGLLLMGFGIAFTKHGALGVSPISSVPNVLSIRFPAVSMGNWLILWNCLWIVAQVLILRRRFKALQLMQVPISFILGWFTDFGMWCISGIPTAAYPMQLLMVAIGVVVLGFGIALAFMANVIMNAGEAFVKVLADRIHKNFGNVKIVFDVCNVALSIVLSLLFFDFTVVGAREGTVIAAFCTGIVVKWFTKQLKAPIEKCLTR